MSALKLSEIQQLRLIYKEIIDGYSFLDPISAYIKHLSEPDNISILKKRQDFFNFYVSNGILPEKEKLEIAYLTEQWTPIKEEEIAALKLRIKDNSKMIESIIPQQQEFIKKAIEKDKLDLAILLLEREQSLGLTAEELSEKDCFRYLIYFCFFKDKDCSIPFFNSWEEFELLSEEEIAKYSQLLESNMVLFSELNIRLISVMPFFINAFSYAKENVFFFLNRPIAYLTNHQLLLIACGSRNLNIASQSKGNPPEPSDNQPVQHILDWYDQNYSIMLGKRDTR